MWICVCTVIQAAFERWSHLSSQSLLNQFLSDASSKLLSTNHQAPSRYSTASPSPITSPATRSYRSPETVSSWGRLAWSTRGWLFCLGRCPRHSWSSFGSNAGHHLSKSKGLYFISFDCALGPRSTQCFADRPRQFRLLPPAWQYNRWLGRIICRKNLWLGGILLLFWCWFRRGWLPIYRRPLFLPWGRYFAYAISWSPLKTIK